MNDKIQSDLNEVLDISDINRILDCIKQERHRIADMIVIFTVKDKPYVYRLCTELSNLEACGLLEWSKLDIYEECDR